MAPEFKPGTFEPVITVSQRSDGHTRALHSVRDGLFEVAESSLYVAFSASLGQGSNTEFSRSAVPALSRVYGQYLWARNLSNQLNHVGINNRFSRDLSSDIKFPEPIVKLFNAYGHVEHEDVNYVQLDLEREFCHAVFDLCEMIKDTDIDDASPDVGDLPQSKWVTRLKLDSSGNIVIHDEEPIRVYVNRLVSHIARRDIDPEYRLRLIKSIIDIATESDLKAMLRWLRSQPNLGNLPPRGTNTTGGPDSKRIHDVLGEHHATQPGSVLDSKQLSRAIRKAVELLKRINDELCTPLAVLPIPRYEQGSLAQMAETVEDISHSNFPLSLADATVIAAFKVGHVLRRFLRSAPEETDDNLRNELVRKSVRRKA